MGHRYDIWSDDNHHHRDAAFVSFLHKLLTPHALLEQDPLSAGFRIRLIAQRICALTGETSEVALESYIEKLCLAPLTTWSILRPDEFVGVSAVKEATDDELRTYVLEAAVYLNLLPVVKQLLNNINALEHHDWSKTSAKWRIRTAAYHGNYEVFVELLSMPESWTTQYRGESNEDFVATLLRAAAFGGSSRIFNFILDHWVIYYPMGPSLESSLTRYRGSKYREECMVATWNAITPKDYRRAFLKCYDTFALPRGRMAKFEKVFVYHIREAIRNGRVEMLQFFLNQLPCLHCRTTGSESENEEMFENLSVNNSRLSNWLKKQLSKLLLKAYKSAAAVKLLLDHGADPNLDDYADTALLRAVSGGCLDVVRTLVEHGADVNLGKPPPIAIAVKHENNAIFRYLRGKGAILDTPETGGWAMTFAKCYGLESMVDILVDEGVDASTVLHRVPNKWEYVCGISALSPDCAYSNGFNRYYFGTFEYNPEDKHQGAPYSLPLECWDEVKNRMSKKSEQESADA